MTRQALDHIVYEGIKFSLLEAPQLPTDDPRLLPFPEEVFSTACWRGYVAEWAVRNRRLYLAGITGVFRLADGVPIAADWYSGVLAMAPDGPDLYSRVFLAKVVDGVVVQSWSERDYPPLPGPE